MSYSLLETDTIKIRYQSACQTRQKLVPVFGTVFWRRFLVCHGHKRRQWKNWPLIGENGVISVNFRAEISRNTVTSRTDQPARDHLSTAEAAEVIVAWVFKRKTFNRLAIVVHTVRHTNCMKKILNRIRNRSMGNVDDILIDWLIDWLIDLFYVTHCTIYTLSTCIN